MLLYAQLSRSVTLREVGGLQRVVGGNGGRGIGLIPGRERWPKASARECSRASAVVAQHNTTMPTINNRRGRRGGESQQQRVEGILSMFLRPPGIVVRAWPRRAAGLRSRRHEQKLTHHPFYFLDPEPSKQPTTSSHGLAMILSELLYYYSALARLSQHRDIHFLPHAFLAVLLPRSGSAPP
jgi:hypothetical protein